MKFKVSTQEARLQLERQDQQQFVTVMSHGSMVAEYYAPVKTDDQSPHERDELYIVTGGSAILLRNGGRTDCSTGDLLFVPARMEHRFENFTDDFAVWVVFYGPLGGE